MREEAGKDKDRPAERDTGERRQSPGDEKDNDVPAEDSAREAKRRRKEQKRKERAKARLFKKQQPDTAEGPAEKLGEVAQWNQLREQLGMKPLQE